VGVLLWADIVCDANRAEGMVRWSNATRRSLLRAWCCE